MIVAGLATMVPSMNLSIMYIVYPELQREFADVSASALSWVFSAYTIVAAATLVLGGVVADRAGRLRALMVGDAMIAVAVVLCGAATHVGVIIAGRVLLALGASLAIPATTALALSTVPEGQRAMAYGVMSAFGGVAAAAGPFLAALVIEASDWRWAFFMNFPPAVLILILSPLTFKESKAAAARALPDAVGAGLLLAGLALTIWALVESPAWGWGSGRTIGTLTLGLALIVGVVVRSRRIAEPILDVSLFRFRNFALLNAASLLVAVGWFGMYFTLTQFLRFHWGYSLIDAGLLISPVPLGAALLGPIGGRFADRFGYRLILGWGAVAFISGALWMIFALPETKSVWMWLPGIILVGIGTGMVFPSVQGGTVVGMPDDRYAVASSMNHTIQRMGSAVGNAVGIMFVASVGTQRGFERMFVVVLATNIFILPAAFAMVRGSSATR